MGLNYAKTGRLSRFANRGHHVKRLFVAGLNHGFEKSKMMFDSTVILAL